MKQDWKYQRLDEVGLIVTGSTPPTSNAENYSSHDRCFVKPSDIAKYEISIINDSEFYISNFAYENCCRKLPKGSVLFTCIGIVGKIGILDVDATCNQQINAILPSGKVTPKFLAYALLSQRYYIQAIANAPVVPIINKKQFSSFSIPVPTIDEQKKICSLLDKMNRVIEAKKEQLKELDNLAQAIFYDMFGDPITNQKGWKIKKIEDIAILNKGISYKPENVVKEGGTIVLRSGNIKGNVFDLEDVVRVDSNINPSKYVHENEILMCNRNGSAKLVGKVAKIPKIKEKMSFGTFMTIVRSDMYEYLFAFFQTDAFREQIRFSTAIAINQISLPLLASVKVPVPPIELQQSFADKIEAIERQKELINQSIKDVQTLFDAKMDYYFGD